MSDHTHWINEQLKAKDARIDLLTTEGVQLMDSLDALRAERDALRAALTELAEREWCGEEKSWRTEALEMRDGARTALAKAVQS